MTTRKLGRPTKKYFFDMEIGKTKYLDTDYSSEEAVRVSNAARRWSVRNTNGHNVYEVKKWWCARLNKFGILYRRVK